MFGIDLYLYNTFEVNALDNTSDTDANKASLSLVNEILTYLHFFGRGQQVTPSLEGVNHSFRCGGAG